jgi:exodeoxyribonuclease VII large subunit
MSTLFDLPFEEPTGAASTGRPTPAAAERVRSPLTVSELTARVREMLETAYAEIWVVGEISNCRLWNTGHLYFTLKDPGAQLKAVMFRSSIRSLKFKPEDGLRVIARGRLSVYDPKGEYQLVCEQMEPQGLGALQLACEQLKRRLQAEGLFDVARKRLLPALPRKIGIVTSLDGAAIRDIIQVLGRRYPNAHIVIRPTRVQGEGAAAEVAKGIADIAAVAGVDVIIVGRGGGSIEDLWAFNEEIVARAIVAAPIPVISAVGHEADVTIADLAADVRAPTPSAAAEIVVSRKEDFWGHIDHLGERLAGLVRTRLAHLAMRVHELNRRPGMAAWPARLALRGRHAAELTHDLRDAAHARVARSLRAHQTLRLQLETHDQRRRLGIVGTRLVGVNGALRAAMLQRRHGANARLQECTARLESLSPLAVLGRGYAVCWNATRTTVIRDAGTLRPGDHVRVTLHRGEIHCDVADISDTDN